MAMVLAGGFGTLIILLWGAILLVVVWGAVAAIQMRRDHTRARPDPMEIIKERLATGEIDSDEYIRLKELIGSDEVDHLR